LRRFCHSARLRWNIERQADIAEREQEVLQNNLNVTASFALKYAIKKEWSQPGFLK
jgi:hypothetical protein